MSQPTPKSSGELHIERIMQELDPTSERYQVLDTARRFKSSWVELGEQLLQVSRSGFFRQWGYESFEDYCTKEIRIKKPTALKLTQAYHFLEKEEPEVLARRTELKPLPDYRSVDLLRQAREEKELSSEDYATLRQAIIDEERSLPTVRKRFNDLVSNQQPQMQDPQQHYKTVMAAARRLAGLLQQSDETPPKLFSLVEEVVAAVEEKIKNLSPMAE
ncbi:MAG TPA: hypothetical protein VJ955_05920 [Desulfuromonadales bacterium]|nr:hypothetical protein [Desulfuromonadales bacterium]